MLQRIAQRWDDLGVGGTQTEVSQFMRVAESGWSNTVNAHNAFVKLMHALALSGWHIH